MGEILTVNEKFNFQYDRLNASEINDLVPWAMENKISLTGVVWWHEKLKYRNRLIRNTIPSNSSRGEFHILMIDSYEELTESRLVYSLSFSLHQPYWLGMGYLYTEITCDQVTYLMLKFS